MAKTCIFNSVEYWYLQRQMVLKPWLNAPMLPTEHSGGVAQFKSIERYICSLRAEFNASWVFSVLKFKKNFKQKLTLSFLNECFLLSTGFGDFKVKGYSLDFPVSSYVFPSYTPAADLFSAPIYAPGTNQVQKPRYSLQSPICYVYQCDISLMALFIHILSRDILLETSSCLCTCTECMFPAGLLCVVEVAAMEL